MDDDQHQELARCLFRESNDALFLFDPRDHHVEDANPVALRLTGVDRSAITSLRIWQLFTAGSGRGIAELIEAYQRTGFFHSREGFQLMRRGAEAIPVNVSVSRIHTRPTPKGLVVARDITERLQAQEQLQESERRFRGLVESARVLIVTLSSAGLVTSVNPEFETRSDWRRSDWLGRPFLELLHPDDRARASACFERAFEDGSAPLFEARLSTKYAGYCDIEVLSLSRLVHGRTAGLSLIARDVTQFRRAEAALRQSKELRRSKELAEVANRTKSEFLAHVSHELRNPLSSILSYTEQLQDDPHTSTAPEDYRAALGVIHRNGAHLAALIEDMLDLSRIEMGQLQIEPSRCDLGDMIADVVETLRPEADAAGCKMAVYLESPDMSLWTAPTRLKQILLNLVANAIHHGASPIEILARSRAVEGSGPCWVIDVRDSGPGLSPGELARVFEPFARGAAATARQPSGAGLGLSISRRLAECLGGQLTAESPPGAGCTFSLMLPDRHSPPAKLLEVGECASSHPPASVEDDQRTDRVLAGLRLLLAEDSDANRRVIALRLERDGALVQSVGDGRSALAEALDAQQSGRPFDALLLDLQLPEFDGFEVAYRLREAGVMVPLIALTAHAMPEDRARCLEQGFSDVVTKPIDWERLLRCVQERTGCGAR